MNLSIVETFPAWRLGVMTEPRCQIYMGRATSRRKGTTMATPEDSSNAPASSGRQETGNPHSAYVFREIIQLVKAGHDWKSAVNSVLYGLAPLYRIQQHLERGFTPKIAVTAALELDNKEWVNRCQPRDEAPSW